jgi:glycosyltransferase involved in cell wall biosynthesis
MQGATCDYSVIIPAYNEEDYLGLTLESLGKARKAVPNLTGECIVVDNQCTDRTVEIAKKIWVPGCLGTGP